MIGSMIGTSRTGRIRGRRTARWALVALLAGAGAWVAAVAVLVGAGLHDRTAQADLIVVPGNTVAPDGTPSPRLRARLDAAIRLYDQGLAPAILVSGGVGVEGYDESVSMADYLVAHGVPARAVIRDGAGLDTRATAAHAAQVMRSRGLTRAIVATQYFHVPRTRLLLEQQGVHVVGSAHARFVEWRDAYSTNREVVAYAVALTRS